MKKDQRVFAVDDLVFAKVRGYPAWPARVTAPADDKGLKFHVVFYGTYETAICKKDELWLFNEETKTRFGKQKRKGFAEALYEIEHEPNLNNQANEQPPENEDDPGSADDHEQEQEKEDKAEDEEQAEVAKEEQNEPIAQSSNPQEPATPEAVEAEDPPEVPEEVAKPMDIEEVHKTPKVSQRRSRNAKRKAEATPVTPSQPPAKQSRSAPQDAADLKPDSPLPQPPPAKQPKQQPAKQHVEEAAVEPPKSVAAPAPPSASVSTPQAAGSVSQQTPVPTAAEKPATTEKTSRSGRALKTRKILDAGSAAPTSSVKATAAESSSRSSPRKMWIQVKSTNDVIEINMDKDRPARFSSKEDEIQWERSTAKNALLFKECVESGEFVPEEIRRRLEQKVKTPQEEDILKRTGHSSSSRKEKIRWLKLEQKITDINVGIQEALHILHPDMNKCLQLLEELQLMSMSPLMLKKQPDIVATLRKVRKYMGPATASNDQHQNEQWDTLAERIRFKADEVFCKIQSLFAVSDGSSFVQVFQDLVDQFKKATKDYSPDTVRYMVADPTAKK